MPVFVVIVKHNLMLFCEGLLQSSWMGILGVEKVTVVFKSTMGLDLNIYTKHNTQGKYVNGRLTVYSH